MVNILIKHIIFSEWKGFEYSLSMWSWVVSHLISKSTPGAFVCVIKGEGNNTNADNKQIKNASSDVLSFHMIKSTTRTSHIGFSFYSVFYAFDGSICIYIYISIHFDLLFKILVLYSAYIWFKNFFLWLPE